jgi:selT/selW/selH-like putative selenoprotein
LAEELERELGLKSELIESGGGVFTVEHGGKIVFSKKDKGRFPDPGEVLKLIRQSK